MTYQIHYVYILKCSDGSYYTGSTNNLEKRLAEHQAGLIEDSYTHSRLPVELVWSAEFSTHDEAFRAERQIKGWSRAKKEALVRGDLNERRFIGDAGLRSGCYPLSRHS